MLLDQQLRGRIPLPLPALPLICCQGRGGQYRSQLGTSSTQAVGAAGAHRYQGGVCCSLASTAAGTGCCPRPALISQASGLPSARDLPAAPLI